MKKSIKAIAAASAALAISMLIETVNIISKFLILVSAHYASPLQLYILLLTL